MKVFSMRTVRGLPAFALMGSSATAASAQTPTSRIVSAANTFLSTLSEKQRQSVLYSFDDEKQRATWSNLPTSFVPRGGIPLKDMNPAQRAAAMALVSAALSAKGFEKVQQIMEGDEVLKATDSGHPPPGNRNGPPPGAPTGPPPGQPRNGANRPPFGGPSNGAMLG